MNAAVAVSAVRIADAELQKRLGGAFDRERKVDRAVASLVGFPRRRVVVVDALGSEHAERLREAGVELTAVPSLSSGSLPVPSADAIVGFWSILDPGSSRFDAELGVLEQALATGGTAVAVHDYGRDDASLVLSDESRRQDLVAWSNRRGPFLGRGFKVHVLHCWWQFESIDQAREVLMSAFGPAGEALGSTLRHPRVSHKVAVYHRTFPATVEGTFPPP